MRVPEVFYCRDIIIVIRQKRNYDIVLLLHYDILRYSNPSRTNQSNIAKDRQSKTLSVFLYVLFSI